MHGWDGVAQATVDLRREPLWGQLAGARLDLEACHDLPRSAMVRL
jgi:hypothetical protein